MNITETIVRLAAPYTAVAFDVFDTLVKRDVAKPTDLFLLAGSDFAKARVQAEAEARAQKQGEVTLAEIYGRPCLARYDPARECALELEAVTPNLPLLDAVRTLQAQGKRIYYISDMYLPPEQIAAMLARCGYDGLDGGFVSCSYGVQKRSGTLFRRFLRETELKASQVLFVGDSWRADVVGAALAGIRAWHLPSHKAMLEFVSADDFAGGAVSAFVQNRVGQRPYDGEVLGFSVLGPLLVAFCRWLHERRVQYGHGKLYFLARDMYLTQQVYGILYPEEETCYLQVSRRSLCPALLAEKEYPLLWAALPRQKLTGAQIAAYCGADCPESFARQSFDLKSEEMPAGLRELFAALCPPPAAELVHAYLRQSGLEMGDLLVDVGSGGTTQILLEALCKIRLHGLQLSGDERLRKRLSDDRAEVFLSLAQEAAKLYWAGQPMLERLISQDIGAAKGYAAGINRITVCREELTPEPVLADIQRGALAFAKAWQTSVLAPVIPEPALSIAPFLHLLAKPSKTQTRLLGDLTVEDGGVYPLAKPQPLAMYLLHPAQMKRDLAESRWKIGFLRRLLPGALPYDRLYLAMKK